MPVRLEAHQLEGLAHGVDDAVAGGFRAAERPADAHGLAGDEAGLLLAVDDFELVHHPDHVLRAGHHVGRRHVLQVAHVLRHLARPAAADRLLLAHAQVVRVADDAALAAAEGDVHHGAFPRHPRRQGPHRIERLVGVEPDAALVRAPRVVVLHAEPAEHLHLPVVHADRDGELELADGPPQELAGALVEVEDVGDFVELGLGHLEGIERLGHVCLSSGACGAAMIAVHEHDDCFTVSVLERLLLRPPGPESRPGAPRAIPRSVVTRSRTPPAGDGPFHGRPQAYMPRIRVTVATRSMATT